MYNLLISIYYGKELKFSSERTENDGWTDER